MARIRAPLRPAPSWLAARTGGPRHERPVGARRAGRCTRCGGKRLAGSESLGKSGARRGRSRATQQDCPPSRHAPPRAAAQRTPLAKGVAPARGPAACPIGLGARPRVGQRGHGRCGGGGATENQREGGEGRGLCCSQRA
ncbi:unnamed protein product [Prorocentrum cordatum]|uniref:Uncharacterized protein n=1 Tax=Prorocentrum cordatum TaxID=2364126 RepID=A0ABN9YKA7_9DINO|nr:unnamed protein product [Polarella glacialis]